MMTSMGELDVVLTPALQKHVGERRGALDTDRVLRFLDKVAFEFSQGCETWHWREYADAQRVGRIRPVYDLTRRVVTLTVLY